MRPKSELTNWTNRRVGAICGLTRTVNLYQAKTQLSALVEALLWLEGGSPKLSRRVFGRIFVTDQFVFVSAATFWEIAIKTRSGTPSIGCWRRNAAIEGSVWSPPTQPYVGVEVAFVWAA
jgi:hypothetical protein